MVAREASVTYLQHVPGDDSDAKSDARRRAWAMFRYACGNSVSVIAGDLYGGNEQHAAQDISVVVTGVRSLNEVKYDGALSEVLIRRMHSSISIVRKQRKINSSREGAVPVKTFAALIVAAAEDESDWQSRAACDGTDPEAFYPGKGGSTRPAKNLCRGCEVRAECLEYALERDERYGIWGGMTRNDRRKLKRPTS